MPEKTPEEQANQTLQSIGAALMGVQLVEHLINICLDLVFKPTPSISAQDLENLGVLERHETLGRLLRDFVQKSRLILDSSSTLTSFWISETASFIACLRFPNSICPAALDMRS
jgi:hypothetical protein